MCGNHIDLEKKLLDRWDLVCASVSVHDDGFPSDKEYLSFAKMFNGGLKKEIRLRVKQVL